MDNPKIFNSKLERLLAKQLSGGYTKGQIISSLLSMGIADGIFNLTELIGKASEEAEIVVVSEDCKSENEASCYTLSELV